MALENIYPGYKDITLRQGQGWNREFGWYEDPDNKFDLTSYVITMDIRLNKDDSTALLELTSADSSGDYIDINTSTDVFNVYISDTTLAALDFQVAYYDILMVKSGEEDFFLIEGKVILQKSSTR